MAFKRKKGYTTTPHNGKTYYKPNGFQLNESVGRKSGYIITGSNRKGQEITNGVATGYQEMKRVRSHMYKSEHTWLKFGVYNVTKGKRIKGA